MTQNADHEAAEQAKAARRVSRTINVHLRAANKSLRALRDDLMVLSHSLGDDKAIYADGQAQYDLDKVADMLAVLRMLQDPLLRLQSDWERIHDARMGQGYTIRQALGVQDPG